MGNQDDFLRGGRAERRRRGVGLRGSGHTQRGSLLIASLSPNPPKRLRVSFIRRREGGGWTWHNWPISRENNWPFAPSFPLIFFSTISSPLFHCPPRRLEGQSDGKNWQRENAGGSKGGRENNLSPSFHFFPFFPYTILGREPRSRSMERSSTGGRWRRSKRGISFFFLFLRYRND